MQPAVYSKYADIYDSTVRHCWEKCPQFADFCVAIAQHTEPSDTVLEVGSGTSLYTGIFDAIVDSRKYSVSEPCPEMLSLARRYGRIPEQVIVHEKPLQDMGEEKYDVLIFMQSLYAILPVVGADLIFERLNPGGRALIFDWAAPQHVSGELWEQNPLVAEYLTEFNAGLQTGLYVRDAAWQLCRANWQDVNCMHTSSPTVMALTKGSSE